MSHTIPRDGETRRDEEEFDGVVNSPADCARCHVNAFRGQVRSKNHARNPVSRSSGSVGGFRGPKERGKRLRLVLAVVSG